MVAFPRGEQVARVVRQHGAAEPRDGVPCYVTSPGLVTIGPDEDGNPLPLPEPRDGVTLLVMPEVMAHAECRERDDVACPFDPIRQEEGANGGPAIVVRGLLVRR